jgi:hypothetical protein
MEDDGKNSASQQTIYKEFFMFNFIEKNLLLVKYSLRKFCFKKITFQSHLFNCRVVQNGSAVLLR